MTDFMFATGIENSYPTIEWQGRTVRQDELAKTKHYERWRDDFAVLGVVCGVFRPFMETIEQPTLNLAPDSEVH